MGQYVAIGIATRISINKVEATRRSEVTIDEVKNALQKQYNMRGIYEQTEDDKYV